MKDLDIKNLDNENDYGHPFRGDTILLIWINNEEANSLYKKARGRNTDIINIQLEVLKSSIIPDHIYFFSEDTIYSSLIKDFIWLRKSCEFTIYGFKSRYFAMNTLCDYDLICKSDNHHNYLLLKKKSPVT